jgi:acid phosphatase (class A)
MKFGFGLALSAALASGAVAFAQPTQPTSSQSTPPPPRYLAGYLPGKAVPSSLSIVPPAPAAGSATQARDDAEAKAARALMGSPRWDLARQDADLHFPAAAETFSCAVGARISPETTPRLYILMRRTLTDAGLATYPTKTKYSRQRPFMVAGGDICTPDEASGLRTDGSYPSGHSAIGWAWALILAEADPDSENDILARGRSFMQSRVVCNVHWLSDTEAGATVGAAVVARLHDDPVFLADLAAAKTEISAARAANLAPARDCKSEAAALAQTPETHP